MWILDAMSRAYRNITESPRQQPLLCSLEETNHAESVCITPYRLTEFRRETANDTVMQSLIISVKNV